MLTCPMGEVGRGGEPRKGKRRRPTSKDSTGNGILVTPIEVTEGSAGGCVIKQYTQPLLSPLRRPLLTMWHLTLFLSFSLVSSRTCGKYYLCSLEAYNLER